MKPTARLVELTTRQSELEAALAEVRAAISRERAHMRERLEANIVARLDAGMTAPDIAKAVQCTAVEVAQILHKWRRREGVKVRRGRTIPERRRLI